MKSGIFSTFHASAILLFEMCVIFSLDALSQYSSFSACIPPGRWKAGCEMRILGSDILQTEDSCILVKLNCELMVDSFNLITVLKQRDDGIECYDKNMAIRNLEADKRKSMYLFSSFYYLHGLKTYFGVNSDGECFPLPESASPYISPGFSEIQYQWQDMQDNLQVILETYQQNRVGNTYNNYLLYDWSEVPGYHMMTSKESVTFPRGYYDWWLLSNADGIKAPSTPVYARNKITSRGCFPLEYYGLYIPKSVANKRDVPIMFDLLVTETPTTVDNVQDFVPPPSCWSGVGSNRTIPTIIEDESSCGSLIVINKLPITFLLFCCYITRK